MFATDKEVNARIAKYRENFKISLKQLKGDKSAMLERSKMLMAKYLVEGDINSATTALAAIKWLDTE